LEYEHLYQYLSNFLNPKVTDLQRIKFSQLNFKHYAGQIYFNLPPPRIDRYNLNNYDDIQTMVTKFTSKINYAIGFNQVSTSYPVLSFMSSYNIFTLFFSLLINLVITIFSVLSIILIYSLLMINGKF
jgi:hypothetical protein